MAVYDVNLIKISEQWMNWFYIFKIPAVVIAYSLVGVKYRLQKKKGIPWYLERCDFN